MATLLPAANALYASLTAGEYLLGVSKSGIEALNADVAEGATSSRISVKVNISPHREHSFRSL